VAASLIKDLQSAIGVKSVLHAPEDLLVYEYDATIERGLPEAVVLPETSEEVAAVVRVAKRHGVPVTARGAGTGLSGGAIPCEGGIVIVTARMDRILKLDPANRLAVVQPGVINLDISKAAAPHGLYYAPDPSSQKACSIGGNVAQNAGGPHTLRYGSTVNHVLGLEIVTPGGDIVTLGGETLGAPGYDLTGLVVGSEGTLAIVTAVVVRLLPRAPATITLLAIFDEVRAASEAVSAVIAGGAGDDRQEDDAGGRAVRQRGLPAGRRRRAADRGRGPRGRDVGAGRGRARNLRSERRKRDTHRHVTGRAREAVGRAQGRSGRAGTASTVLLHPGRRCTAHAPARRTLEHLRGL